ncbi:tumor necrosis factor receptor superfamily member 14-like isoform X2 [Cynoglossus semilaevis]|uniref:tumor necrosis factor receptor superfamily member 14-like isoform X2 n=1 Tax=Cynoglossus semilaevis TaxID=244447 RepID=UPI000D62D1F7|nr:tumor necrosis factor receptor superfamily member 14-like isoform X2 [Cynoglossus semilaevis]
MFSANLSMHLNISKLTAIAAFILVFMSLAVRSETCSDLQYLVGTVCCKKCDFGFFVKKDCKSPSRDPVCYKCYSGTFMNVSNGLKECFNCTECNPDLGLEISSNCVGIRDTTCKPLDGFFCTSWLSDDHCEAAQKHTHVCPPGQFIKTNGTALNDTECAACPAGKSVSLPHPQCQSSADAKHEHSRYSIWILLTLFIVLIIIGILAVFPILKAHVNKVRPVH